MGFQAETKSHTMNQVSHAIHPLLLLNREVQTKGGWPLLHSHQLLQAPPPLAHVTSLGFKALIYFSHPFIFLSFLFWEPDIKTRTFKNNCIVQENQKVNKYAPERLRKDIKFQPQADPPHRVYDNQNKKQQTKLLDLNILYAASIILIMKTQTKTSQEREYQVNIPYEYRCKDPH